jgi:y4mF family transcriptional regulator
MRRKLPEIQENVGAIAWFVRMARKDAGLTQEKLAQDCGVGLRFLRELELGKETLRLDKVQQVLQFFGYELGAVPLPDDRR